MLKWILLFLLCGTTTSLDSECYMTVPEIARHFGYSSAVHLVRTSDDFLLEIHRIYKNSSASAPVVFMQHGLFADGFNFLPNLPFQSAATVFADAGFDVWVSNSRGTPASQKHIGFGPDDDRFWNFTWQDMAEKDLTASVDYVLNETGQAGLYYIGHSQGTVIAFATLSQNPEFNKKIYQFHALAPVATVSHIGGLFKVLGARLFDFAEFILHRVPNWPLRFPKFINKLIAMVCDLPFAQNLCTLEIGIVDGTETQFNMSRVGVYMCHMPAATSTKNLLHWVQIVKSQKFQKFDYGLEGNKIQYGQDYPPQYNLTNIKTPTYLYWSKDDILADTDDIRDTILAKMNKTIAGNLELLHYTHLDFVFGVNATIEVYRPIIGQIEKDHKNRRNIQLTRPWRSNRT